MLDLPELFAPASSVRGRTSIVCSSKIDLNPPTERVVIVTGPSGDSLLFPFDLDILDRPLARQFAAVRVALSQEAY